MSFLPVWLRIILGGSAVLFGSHYIRSCVEASTDYKICNIDEQNKRIEQAIDDIKKKYEATPGTHDISELNDKLEDCTKNLLDLQTKCDLLSDECKKEAEESKDD